MTPKPKTRGFKIHLAAALSAALLVLTLMSANPLTRSAEGYSRSIVTSSIAVYASLRAINAFLSTAQEIEVGASFVASGSVQPLKMLEPLDDTVERVASVVLTVTMVSGVMVLGFAPVAGLGYAMVMLGWLLGLAPSLREAGRRVIGLGLVTGIIAPLAFIAAGVLGDLVTQNVLAQHEATLDQLARDISPELGAAISDGTFSERLLSSFSGVTDTAAAVTKAKEAAQMIFNRSDELLGSYVQIIGAYVLKGVVLPLILMLVALAVFRQTAPRA